MAAGSKESYTLTSALQRYAEFSVTPRKFCPYVHRRAVVTRFGPARDIAGKEFSCLLFYLTGWSSCLITRLPLRGKQDSSILHLPKGGRRDGEGACADAGNPLTLAQCLPLHPHPPLDNYTPALRVSRRKISVIFLSKITDRVLLVILIELNFLLELPVLEVNRKWNHLKISFLLFIHF